jgi:hypothetical protein
MGRRLFWCALCSAVLLVASGNFSSHSESVNDSQLLAEVYRRCEEMAMATQSRDAERLADLTHQVVIADQEGSAATVKSIEEGFRPLKSNAVKSAHLPA